MYIDRLFPLVAVNRVIRNLRLHVTLCNSTAINTPQGKIIDFNEVPYLGELNTPGFKYTGNRGNLVMPLRLLFDYALFFTDIYEITPVSLVLGKNGKSYLKYFDSGSFLRFTSPVRVSRV